MKLVVITYNKEKWYSMLVYYSKYSLTEHYINGNRHT